MEGSANPFRVSRKGIISFFFKYRVFPVGGRLNTIEALDYG